MLDGTTSLLPTGLEDTSDSYVCVPWKLAQCRLPGLLLSASEPNASTNPCKRADIRLWERRDDFDSDSGSGEPASFGLQECNFGRAVFIMGGNTFRKFGIHLLVLDSVSSYLRSAMTFRCGQETMKQHPQQDNGGASSSSHSSEAALRTNIRVTINVPSDITTDPRVLDCFIFFAYTGLLVDIHGRTLSSMKIDEIRSPVLRFDAMELYMLADFLQVSLLLMRSPFVSMQCVLKCPFLFFSAS